MSPIIVPVQKVDHDCCWRSVTCIWNMHRQCDRLKEQVILKLLPDELNWQNSLYLDLAVLHSASVRGFRAPATRFRVWANDRVPCRLLAVLSMPGKLRAIHA